MPTSLNEILKIQHSFYKLCNFMYMAPIIEKESQEYSACSYTLNNNFVKFRIAKKTPLKIGHFVAIWKRLPNGKTAPYDYDDNVDFFVLTIEHQNQIGQFIFPKSVLIEKNILSNNKKGGKLGIRIYSPWDRVTSKQAKQSQEWQIKYFVDISVNTLATIERLKKLYLF